MVVVAVKMDYIRMRCLKSAYYALHCVMSALAMGIRIAIGALISQVSYGMLMRAYVKPDTTM